MFQETGLIIDKIFILLRDLFLSFPLWIQIIFYICIVIFVLFIGLFFIMRTEDLFLNQKY